MQKKIVSVVVPTFNEEENIKKLYLAIIEQIKKIKKTIDIDYEIIFIDNDSSDSSQEVIKLICKDDINVKAIFNLKNYGHIRSPYYGILQARGDAIIYIAADFQDPVDLLPELVFKWINGSKIVLFQRTRSNANYFLEKIKFVIVFISFFFGKNLVIILIIF